MSQQVLFDVDPGCDDAVMLAMALGLDDIEVVGLSTVCGNSTVENTTRNALSILELGGYEVPVALGCGRPLLDDLTTAEWIHGEGGLRGAMPEPETEAESDHGAEFIVEQARTLGEDLIIAAVGPLPNLATALALEPDLPDMVGDIYLMGGSAFGLGNATPAAEANFRNDPESAGRVIQDARPRMVGLDVTNSATIPHERVSEYQDADGVLGVVGDWLDYPDDVLDFSTDGPPVHDAAVAAAIVDSNVLTFEEYHCEVDTTGGPSYGSVVCDAHGVLDAEPNVEVAVDIDVERYRELVTKGLEAFAG